MGLWGAAAGPREAGQVGREPESDGASLGLGSSDLWAAGSLALAKRHLSRLSLLTWNRRRREQPVTRMPCRLGLTNVLSLMWRLCTRPVQHAACVHHTHAPTVSTHAPAMHTHVSCSMWHVCATYMRTHTYHAYTHAHHTSVPCTHTLCSLQHMYVSHTT